MVTFWDPASLHYVIDWSAWATLIVGIAAVIGAYKIGKKQADIAHRQVGITDRQAQIMERQTAISAQQAEVEQIRLRAELYDRRVVIYGGIEQYLEEASSNDGKVPNEARDGLFKAISVARFLIGDDVEKIAKDIYMAATALRADVGRLDRLQGSDDVQRQDHITKVMGDHDRLNDLGLRLRATMERYLRLSDVQATDPGADLVT